MPTENSDFHTYQSPGHQEVAVELRHTDMIKCRVSPALCVVVYGSFLSGWFDISRTLKQKRHFFSQQKLEEKRSLLEGRDSARNGERARLLNGSRLLGFSEQLQPQNPR